MNSISQTLEHIVLSITKNPNITVSSAQENDVVRLTIQAPSDIIGQIIGRQGRTIKSIRALISIAFPSIHHQIDVIPQN